MCPVGVIALKLGCKWVLLSYQRFKRWVNTILDITSFDRFSLDITGKPERIFYLVPFSLGDESKSLTWSHQMISPYIQLKFSASLSEDYALVFFWLLVLLLFWILSSHISVALLGASFSFGLFELNFHIIFLYWRVDWILSNISSWMQKVSWSDKLPSGLSQIPNKSHPIFNQIVVVCCQW